MIWDFGLVILFCGGEGLVRGSVSLARRFGLSSLLIGIIVVGFGTSLPGLLVSATAALRGSPDIALGNVVGSNIANILLIIGLAGLRSLFTRHPGRPRRHPRAPDPQNYLFVMHTP